MQASLFEQNELLCRAVRPKGIYYKSSGRLSDAAFKDSKGLSVDRQAGRVVAECVRFMLDDRKLEGDIYTVTYHDCDEVDAVVLPLPTRDDAYHCEIHGSDTEILLTDVQAKMLSLVARCVHQQHK